MIDGQIDELLRQIYSNSNQRYQDIPLRITPDDLRTLQRRYAYFTGDYSNPLRGAVNENYDASGTDEAMRNNLSPLQVSGNSMYGGYKAKDLGTTLNTAQILANYINNMRGK